MNEIPTQSKNPEWFHENLLHIEKDYKEKSSVPFTVFKIKENGFEVKVYGIYAVVPFNLMPWNYSGNNHWSAVFASIFKKIFFGKIYYFNKEKSVIIIDAKIPQFKRMNLIRGCEYKSIIISKSDKKVIVDLGHHFQWQCGSFYGSIYFRHFSDYTAFDNLKAGDVLMTTYLGIDNRNRLVLTCNPELEEWKRQRPSHLIGQRTWAKVLKTGNETSFLVEDNYKSTAFYSETKGIRISPKKMIKIFESWQNGDYVNCEVISINDRERLLNIKLKLDFIAGKYTPYSLSHNTDNEVL